MKSPLTHLFLIFTLSFGTSVFADHHGSKPIKALMIAGGCCHDYHAQTNIIAEGLSKRVKNIDWTIVHEGDKYFSSISALAYDEGERIVYFTDVNKYVLQRWVIHGFRQLSVTKLDLGI